MKRTPIPAMPADAVLDFLRLLNEQGIEVILDGGWAVDALLGTQTRSHDDLDIAVFHEDVPAIRKLLEERGFEIIPRDDSWECNFVYGNEQGHLIDIHSCSFDENGNNIYGVEYSWEALQGQGEIEGCPVRCIPPEILVGYHSGYTLDQNDYHDVRLLCDQFDLQLPEDYLSFFDHEGEQIP
jgi:lincosamide nucleotidyltransferase A/C/D/E